MAEKPPADFVVAIFGPTAVGKSRVALAVANALGGEIISADSMQIYRGLPVLTDQPPERDLKEVPHHLVGTVPLNEDYNAARFAREARKIIREVSAGGRLPLLVGGTGLYMRALLGGFSFGAGERDRLWSPESPYQVLCFGLVMPREELYRMIDARVERMLAGGAVAEVRQARRGKVSRTASQAIGFADICRHLEGRLSLDEAAAVIRQKSRRYAKRQLTWMRKMPDIVRIDLAAHTSTAAATLISERIQSIHVI